MLIMWYGKYNIRVSSGTDDPPIQVYTTLA